jgi:hypothetical protein
MAALQMSENLASRSTQQMQQWPEGLDDGDLDELTQASHDDTKIVLGSPVRLGYYAIYCLMVNRMTGTIGDTLGDAMKMSLNCLL